MVSRSNPSARSTITHRRRGSSRDGADQLFGPLVFSMMGLLADCLALLIQGDTSLAPLRFSLIAGAAPIAALVALWLADHADEIVS